MPLTQDPVQNKLYWEVLTEFATKFLAMELLVRIPACLTGLMILTSSEMFP